MPFKSEAQRRYMHWAENKGMIKKGTSHEYEEKTKGKLPERLHPKGTYHKLKKMMEKK
jgi:hypothetical protein